MIDSKTIIKKFEFLSQNKREESWQEDLFEMGIWSRFKPVYDLSEIVDSNVIVAFIVFAFSGHSNMIHLHRDRIENKKDILIELGVPPSDIESGKWYEVVYNKTFEDGLQLEEDNEVDDEDSFIKKFREAVKWLISWQLDSKFKLWISLREFASANTTYANEPCPERMQIASKVGAVWVDTPDHIRATTTSKKASILQQCMEIEADATSLEQKLKAKYVTLDSIIEQELMATGMDVDYDIRRVEDRLQKKKNS